MAGLAVNRLSGLQRAVSSYASGLRLGLCCQFVEQPIKFRRTTVTAMQRLAPDARRQRLSALCLANAQALHEALRYCRDNGIGCFRVNSQILPVRTHPEVGYQVADLPDATDIVATFEQCGRFARAHDLRLTFHPDQFVILNSPRADVVERSIAELESQAEVAQWLGADVILIHAGGTYGDKVAALCRFALQLPRLSATLRERLAVENDDTNFTPADLLPLCHDSGIPLVYDVHHHRCLADGLTVEQATIEARRTWNREPLFHLSSPLGGWSSPRPKLHADYIDPRDFPECWLREPMTVEIEAKAKELAIAHLRQSQSVGLSQQPSLRTPRHTGVRVSTAN